MAASTRPEVQPADGAAMTAHTSASSPAPESAAPAQSTGGAAASRASGTTRSPRRTASTHSGTLTRKIDPQAKWSSSQPPSTGPRATPSPAVAAQIPIAAARSRASANTAGSSDSVAGMMQAAPAPMTARLAINPPLPPAVAAAAEATANTPRPATSSRRRPNRSPSVPASSSRAAKTSV